MKKVKRDPQFEFALLFSMWPEFLKIWIEEKLFDQKFINFFHFSLFFFVWKIVSWAPFGHSNIVQLKYFFLLDCRFSGREEQKFVKTFGPPVVILPSYCYWNWFFPVEIIWISWCRWSTFWATRSPKITTMNSNYTENNFPWIRLISWSRVSFRFK